MKLGTRHLNQFLKNINKTVGKTKNNTQMAITGKCHGCHFKKRETDNDCRHRKKGWSKKETEKDGQNVAMKETETVKERESQTFLQKGLIQYRWICRQTDTYRKSDIEKEKEK